IPAGGPVQRAGGEGGRFAVAPDEADRPEEDAVGTLAACFFSAVASVMSWLHGLSSPLPSFISGRTASSGFTMPITIAPTPFAASLPMSGDGLGWLKVPRT